MFKNVQELPTELIEAYYEMVKENIKIRLKNDEDYQKAKESGSK